MRILILALCLSGCTVSVVDSRLTREEVFAAFKDRDEHYVAKLKEQDETLKALAGMISDLKTAKK